MKHAARWVKAAVLVTALGASGIARAQSQGGPATSSPAASGTGIPQFAEPPVGRSGDEAESRTVNPPESAAPPSWYAVIGAETQPQPRPSPEDLRRLQVPRWYAVS